ncbi:phytanoyl-CoA dioxygenase family protein [Xylanibacillus composti]|uniref:Protein involved in biosynthesis of mitomycin antibiotics/polyketide fumonisin n=1 Tax=Xylanibacillus composti TaxID=1572762 RepID=A0A8J4H4I0_9BACL|nr:phytanoyl-CoA dioxygenase family protein [Xylanibacillus composti]MDT9726707.1 phytanoyl-CoA dioxygenase family protein [Xylanibacillus composti]GIQ69361.1 protein involved in biosynthesis of mitomycin antibiotics/polyketide fumonisin [Xylanibacillus composti]
MIRKLTDDELRFLHKEGYLVLEQLYALEEIEDIRQAFDHMWIDAVVNKQFVQQPNRPLTSLYPPVRDRHLSHERLMQLMLDPRNIALAEQLLGEEPLAVGCDCFFKAPGADVLPFHQDNYDIGAEPGTTWAVWISLDQADPENGALRFVPGTQHFELIPPRLPSHLSAYGQAVRVPEGYKAVDVSTSPGDVVLFNGQVLHGSHANRTLYRFRRSFVTHYVGSSVQKIYVHYLDLYDRHGNVVKRKLNRMHKLQFDPAYRRKTSIHSRKPTS